MLMRKEKKEMGVPSYGENIQGHAEQKKHCLSTLHKEREEEKQNKKREREKERTRKRTRKRRREMGVPSCGE